MSPRLNKFVYLPSRGVLVINLVFFAVLVAFAIIGYFAETINKALEPLSKSDTSLGMATSILFLGLLGVFVLIFASTRKFFLCSYQCLHATAGTTVVVTLVYAAIWSLIQIAGDKQRFVLFSPGSWSVQGTVNNLKYGSVLLLFVSSLSLFGSWVISFEPGHDFTPLLKQWAKWKRSVEKLSKSTRLTDEEHNELLKATRGMLEAIDSIAEPAQPVALASARCMRDPLERFQIWYTKQTNVSSLDCYGLDDEIRNDAQQILHLC